MRCARPFAVLCREVLGLSREASEHEVAKARVPLWAGVWLSRVLWLFPRIPLSQRGQLSSRFAGSPFFSPKPIGWACWPPGSLTPGAPNSTLTGCHKFGSETTGDQHVLPRSRVWPKRSSEHVTDEPASTCTSLRSHPLASSQAYRKLAQRHHPDKNLGRKLEAEETARGRRADAAR